MNIRHGKLLTSTVLLLLVLLYADAAAISSKPWIAMVEHGFVRVEKVLGPTLKEVKVEFGGSDPQVSTLQCASWLPWLCSYPASQVNESLTDNANYPSILPSCFDIIGTPSRLLQTP